MKLFTSLVLVACSILVTQSAFAQHDEIRADQLQRGQVWSVKSEKYSEVRITILSAECPLQHGEITHIKIDEYPKINPGNLSESISDIPIVTAKLIPGLDQIIRDDSENMAPISKKISAFWEARHLGHHNNISANALDYGIEELLDRLLPAMRRNATRSVIEVSTIDNAPDWLSSNNEILLLPIRPLRHEDGAQYQLAKLQKPIMAPSGEITHLIVGSRVNGQRLKKGSIDLPINIAIITDNSLIEEQSMDFDKGEFIATGIASVLQNPFD